MQGIYDELLSKLIAKLTIQQHDTNFEPITMLQYKSLKVSKWWLMTNDEILF